MTLISDLDLFLFQAVQKVSQQLVAVLLLKALEPRRSAVDTHTHTHNHCAQQTFPPHSHLCHLLAQCCMYDCLLPKDTCGWVEVGFTSSKHCLTNINNVTITVNHLLRRNNLTECLRVRLLLLLCIVVD